MASKFSYEFSTTSTPEEARARLQGVITERLRQPPGAGGTNSIHHRMRLAGSTPTSLSYKPKLVVPLPVSFSVWLGRVMRGEHVDVTFTADGADVPTRMTVSGKVGQASEAIAAQEFWAGVLSGV